MLKHYFKASVTLQNRQTLVSFTENFSAPSVDELDIIKKEAIDKLKTIVIGMSQSVINENPSRKKEIYKQEWQLTYNWQELITHE